MCVCVCACVRACVCLCLCLFVVFCHHVHLGLFLNRGKSLHIPTDCTPDYNLLPAEIPIARDGFDLLDSPIGPSTFCVATVLWRVRKVQNILEPLRDLQDSQMETALLRSCFSLPKVTFVLRSCPPDHLKDTILFLTSQCWRPYLT